MPAFVSAYKDINNLNIEMCANSETLYVDSSKDESGDRRTRNRGSSLRFSWADEM